LALSPDGTRLYVTCAAPQSQIVVIEVASGKTAKTFPAGHTAMAPVPSPDGKRLYVCNRFNDSVAAYDTRTGKESFRVAVPREPVAAALTPDGRFLFVANHLHSGRADVDVVAAEVSVIDTKSRKEIKRIALPNGSSLLRGVCVSPDGKYVCVTHVLARFHLPTTQLERGWMNTSGLSIIDVAKLKLLNTVLLDNVDSGAANPWAVVWAADGKTICATHAGTHEVSVIDAAALLAKLAKMPEKLELARTPDYSTSSRVAADVPNDLAFLVGVRRRVKLDGHGPRALALAGGKVYAANYFSDSLSAIDLAATNAASTSIPLAAAREPSLVRKGEFYFNDASICFQGWQSCATCHSSDARVDAMNWDLLNDGIGNPKNNKSLLLVHQTPPAMSTGVRESAEAAVRAGIRHILFTVQPPEVADGLDAYLKSLRPVPSPRLVKGKLSVAAKRGGRVYRDPEVGCAKCHVAPLFTDLKPYNVGTAGPLDREVTEFDTPTLVEIWRTAPYLHDGSAVTIRDVLTTANRNDQHGKTSHLTADQINDLMEYLLSL